MNMISTGAFQTEMDASDKQTTIAKKFAAVWEKKNAKAARAGGVSLMALSLAACGSDDSTTTTSSTSTSTSTTTTTTTTVTPVASSLTVASDTVTGTTGNDTVSGGRVDGVQTLNSGDSISLGDGTDSLTANLNAVTVAPTITGVENVTFTAIGAGTVDFVNTTGVSSITNSGSTATLTVDNVAAIAPITITNTASDTTVVFKTAAASGTADTLTINLTDMTAGTITVGSEADADGSFETIAFVATGTNTTTDLVLGTTATTVTASGAGSLDLNATSEFILVTSVDASAMTGDFDLTLVDRNLASTTKDLSVLTGSGNDDISLAAIADTDVDNITVNLGAGDDRLVLDANTDTGNSINGGDGTDTLQLDIAMSATVAAYASNFETLELNMAGDVAQDMDNADGMNTINIFDSTAAASNLTITNAQDDLVINMNGALLAATDAGTGANEDIDTVTVGLKTDTATDALTVNLNAAAGGVNVDEFKPSVSYETVTVTSSGTAENTIQTVTTALNNITLTGGTALELTSTGSLTGVVDASEMTGAFTTTTSTTAITVTGGSGADTLTSGAIATNTVQTLNGGAGNDTLTAGSVVLKADLYMNGGDGSDTIVATGMAGATSKVADTFANGGAGIDFITLDATATDSIGYVVSTVTSTADADKVAKFTTLEDHLDYNGTLKNDSITTVETSTATTLAAALSGNADATVMIDSGNLTGDAATTLTALANTTNADAFATAAASFEAALVALEGTITGLDATIGSGETVLMAFDNGADSVTVRVQNTDTSTANTLTVAEVEIVAVYDAAVVVAADYM
jgi:hypothetical protein